MLSGRWDPYVLMLAHGRQYTVPASVTAPAAHLWLCPSVAALHVSAVSSNKSAQAQTTTMAPEYCHHTTEPMRPAASTAIVKNHWDSKSGSSVWKAFRADAWLVDDSLAAEWLHTGIQSNHHGLGRWQNAWQHACLRLPTHMGVHGIKVRPEQLSARTAIACGCISSAIYEAATVAPWHSLLSHSVSTDNPRHCNMASVGYSHMYDDGRLLQMTVVKC